MSEAVEHVTVFLEEEYGYRHWIWRPGMTADELVAWWKVQESLPFFSPKGSLPGTVHQVHHDDDGFHVVVDADDDDEYDAKLDPDNNGFHETGEVVPYPPGYSRGDERPRDFWAAHIHMDEDSYLKGPDGTYHHHASYGRRFGE